MIVRCFGFVALFVVLLCGMPARSAQLALVIGNDAYQKVPALERAAGDARAIGGVLQALGYSVTVADDLDYKGMAHAVADFAAKVQPGDTVVFQFSGHGVAIDGQNYLLPVDIEQPRNGDAAATEALSFDAGKIVAQLSRNKPKLVFAILDACRDNPFETKSRSVGATRGLARMDVGPGEFILYSAGPGEEALDRLGDDDLEKTSVFTRVLLRNLGMRGITLQKLAKATQAGVTELASRIQHEQFPDYFDRTVDEPVLSAGAAEPANTPVGAQCTSPLLGRWTNVDANARGLDHLVVSATCPGGRTIAFAIEAFGRCSPTPCPWGVQPAKAGATPNSLSGRFDFSFAIKDLTAGLRPDHRLDVTTATRFIDKSGRKPRNISETLTRVADLPR